MDSIDVYAGYYSLLWNVLIIPFLENYYSELELGSAKCADLLQLAVAIFLIWSTFFTDVKTLTHTYLGQGCCGIDVVVG